MFSKKMLGNTQSRLIARTLARTLTLAEVEQIEDVVGGLGPLMTYAPRGVHYDQPPTRIDD